MCISVSRAIRRGILVLQRPHTRHGQGPNRSRQCERGPQHEMVADPNAGFFGKTCTTSVGRCSGGQILILWRAKGVSAWRCVDEVGQAGGRQAKWKITTYGKADTDVRFILDAHACVQYRTSDMEKGLMAASARLCMRLGLEFMP
eukprot:jgi/Botrbrau1/1297/Bobra.0063s0014.1